MKTPEAPCISCSILCSTSFCQRKHKSNGTISCQGCFDIRLYVLIPTIVATKDWRNWKFRQVYFSTVKKKVPCNIFFWNRKPNRGLEMSLTCLAVYMLFCVPSGNYKLLIGFYFEYCYAVFSAHCFVPLKRVFNFCLLIETYPNIFSLPNLTIICIKPFTYNPTIFQFPFWTKCCFPIKNFL